MIQRFKLKIPARLKQGEVSRWVSLRPNTMLSASVQTSGGESNTKKKNPNQKQRNIIKMDLEAKLESVTTATATYLPPKSPGVRLKGVRRELMEKHCARLIREKIHAQKNPPAPEMEFCSTTRTDFGVEGFVPLTPETTKVHDYKCDQAISFWSENHQRIQGVTAPPTAQTPFRKSTYFSTPIGERLDDLEPPYDD